MCMGSTRTIRGESSIRLVTLARAVRSRRFPRPAYNRGRASGRGSNRMQTTFNQSENPWQLGATGGRIARWFFGFGFFCVSLGVYLITGMTLLTINLLRDPGDLWVDGPLFRWGMLVFVHFLGAVVC